MRNDSSASKEPHVRYHSENAKNIAGFVEEHDNPHRDEFIDRVREGKVLDLGCGHGKEVEYFIEEGGLEAVGVDLAEGMLDESERREKKGKYYEKDFRNLPNEEPFRDEEYDGIWANAALKFYPKDEMEQIVSDWSRLLKPGGTFYASFKLKGDPEKDYEWLEEDENGNEYMIRDGEDFPRYLLESEKEAVEMLESQGYKVQETHVSSDHTEYDIDVMNVFCKKNTQ